MIQAYAAKMKAANLQARLIYGRLLILKEMAPFMKVAFLRFPAVSVTSLATSTILAAAYSSGHLPSTALTARGTGSCITILQESTVINNKQNGLSPYVLFGIDPVRYVSLSHRVDYFSI